MRIDFPFERFIFEATDIMCMKFVMSGPNFNS